MPTLDELIEYVKQGAHLWYDRERNRIRVRVPGLKSFSIPYDEHIWRKLREAKGETVEEQKALKQPAVSDVSLWNTIIAKRRPLIEELIEKVGWFQSAVLDIGTNTILISFLISGKRKPEEIKSLLESIKDKKQFVSFIMENIMTLYQAATDVDALKRLRERNRLLDLKLTLAKETVDSLYRENQNLRRRLDIALSVMDRKGLIRYAKVLALSSIGEEVPQVAPQQVEGEIEVE